MPQVRWDTNDLDFRNNVIFDWSGYGMRIRNAEGQTGSRKVNANVVNNYFIPGNGNPRQAFFMGKVRARSRVRRTAMD